MYSGPFQFPFSTYIAVFCNRDNISLFNFNMSVLKDKAEVQPSYKY